MRLTFTTSSGEMVTLDLADDMELENVKALCEEELKISASKMFFSANGKRFTNDKETLSALGLKDGDVCLVQALSSGGGRPFSSGGSSGGGGGGPGPSKIPKIDFSNIAVPGAAAVSRPSSSRSTADTAPPGGLSAAELTQAKLVVEQLRRKIEEDPEVLEKMMKEAPELVNVVMKNDFFGVVEYIKKEKKEAERKMNMLYSNPDSMEAQQLIHDEIRRRAIQDNFEYAIEHTPESMGSVHMLYVHCSVNGKEMKAFVDSGAQISIISREYAERCNIGHLIDERIRGMAVGVGTQRFIGKIHACQMSIGGAFLTTSFSVLEEGSMQILLGLDMLRRHQMVIDLKRNVLIVGTTNSETSFLSESEIPSHEGEGGKFTPFIPFIPNEHDIQALVGMGFSVEEAKKALIKFEGNKNAAASELLSQRGSQPPASGSK